MNYTVHQLEIFLKVVETKSVTKTAKTLFMSQPAVSIQLKKFQSQFDIPLTEVIGRRLYVTDFGKEIAEIAERVVQELEMIDHKRQDYKKILTGKLKISSASTGKYVIPYFLNGFLEKHKGIDLKLDVTNKTRVIESLESNEIDFALISVVPEKLNLEEEIILDNKLYLMGKNPDRDGSKPLIYREQGSATRAAMEDYFEGVDERKSKRLELTSNEAVKQAVIAGIGQSVMPLIGVKNELVNGQIHIIPFSGLPVVTKWRLVWLRSKKLSPVSEAFLTYIRKEKDHILKAYFKWYLDF